MNQSASTFTNKIHVLVAKIPAGKVATYGQIAMLAGYPGAARAVGMCMRNNKNTKTVPCHRVVASDGALTGYAFGGVTVKAAKLKREGVVFVGNKVDLQKSKWNGK